MEIGLEIQMLLTVSFLISGLSKIVSFEDFLNTLSYFFKKKSLLKVIGYLVATGEVIIGASLAIPTASYFSLIIAIIFLISFFIITLKAINITRKSSMKIKCNCFGGLQAEFFNKFSIVKILIYFLLVFYLLTYPDELNNYSSLLDIITSIMASVGVIILYSMVQNIIYFYERQR